MAHHSLIRPTLGSWVGAVTQDEFWALDSAQYRAINGDGGGTWAPSTQIVIGGSGLQVSGAFVASGASTMGATTISSLVATAAELNGVTKVAFTGTNRVTYASRTFDFEQQIMLGQAVGSVWVTEGYSTTANRPSWVATSTTEDSIWIPLRLPHGSTLVEVGAYFEMLPHGSVPATGIMRLQVGLTPYGVRGVSVGGSSATSWGGSAAAYGTSREVVATVGSLTDRSQPWWVRVISESGAGAVANNRLVSIRTRVSMTSEDEHGI